LARLIKGDVVIVPFPFSDLTQAKRRPALVISVLKGNDAILCQITSRTVMDECAISLRDEDFVSGSLKQRSNVRPNKIFTADQHLILYRVGHLRKDKFVEVIEKIMEIIKV